MGRGESASDTVSDTPRTKASPIAELPARFTVKKPLGEGGMGTVVEAYDRVLSRDVAIKILGAEQKADPNVGTRFLREARAAARLKHPGIVQVYDVDVDGGYIVMELVRGESLATRLWREKKLAVAEVRRIAGALSRALAEAHSEGIIHRDVKPANVLMGEGGEIKLADFGVAHFGDSELTMQGSRVGTPAYMPPEQLRGKVVDARADVYSAGVTLFEAAVGERPSDDRDADHEAQVLAATGDRVLAVAIARAIRERPGERFADGAAFCAALDITEVPSSPPTARVATAPRPKLPIAIAIAVVLGIGVGVTLRVVERRATSHKPPAAATAPHTIALLPFVETTKNPMLDFAATGLPNLLGLELHDVPGVAVVGYYKLADVAGAGAPRDAWVEAARTLGADIVVQGELTATPTGVHVAIAVDRIDGEHIDRIERDARVEEVPEVVRQTAPALVRIALGRTIDLAGKGPRSFDADRELQLGIAELEREHLTEAIDHLRAAIHHAPDNALAHYYLAIALTWRAPSRDATEEIAKALAYGELDEAQRGILRAASNMAGLDYVAGIAILQPLAEAYPQNRELLYMLFECLFHGGRATEAMAVYKRIHAIAPKFRLALIHLFTYYVSHSDEEGMTWVLALSEPSGDSYNPTWEPQIVMARREYAQAIELLLRQITAAPAETARMLQSLLVTAYVFDGRLELAEALLSKLDETGGEDHLVRLSLAIARGDTAGRAKHLDAMVRAYATQPAGPTPALSLALLAGAIAPAATRAELAAIAKALPDRIVPGYERSLNLQIGQVFLADGLDDTAHLEQLAHSAYPEVAELARAAVLRRQGDHAAAAAALRHSLAATGDARFLLGQWWLLARELRASGDHAGVLAACDEALRPRLMAYWSWGASARDCFAWTAEAATALGKPEVAAAAQARLAALAKR